MPSFDVVSDYNIQEVDNAVNNDDDGTQTNDPSNNRNKRSTFLDLDDILSPSQNKMSRSDFSRIKRDEAVDIPVSKVEEPVWTDNAVLGFLRPFYQDVVGLATSEQMHAVRLTLHSMYRVDLALTVNAKKTVGVLNAQQQQLQIIDESLSHLTQLVADTVSSLTKEFRAIPNDLILTGQMKLDYNTLTFIKVGTSQSDLSLEVTNLEVSLRAAIRGSLTSMAISPQDLFSALVTFQNNFDDDTRLLWPMKKVEDTRRIYKLASKEFINLSGDRRSILVLNLPVYRANHLALKYSIYTLPFFMSKRNQRKFVIQQDDSLNKLQVLKFENKIYDITDKDIAIGQGDPVGILLSKKLFQVKPLYQTCIRKILNPSIMDLGKACNTRNNYLNTVFLTPRPELLIYFSPKATTLNTTCYKGRAREYISHVHHLIGNGLMFLPKACQVHTNYFTLYPDEFKVAEEAHVWHTQISGFSLPDVIQNINLLGDLVQHTQNLTQQDYLEIQQTLESTNSSQIAGVSNFTAKALEYIQQGLSSIDQKNQYTQNVLAFLKNPGTTSVTFIIILTTIFAILVTYICKKLGLFRAIGNCCLACCNKNQKIVTYEPVSQPPTYDYLHRQMARVLDTWEEDTSTV